ncbi:MAG: hypothetical protein ABI451_03530, partial [Dokdonella sp.]
MTIAILVFLVVLAAIAMVVAAVTLAAPCRCWWIATLDLLLGSRLRMLHRDRRIARSMLARRRLTRRRSASAILIAAASIIAGAIYRNRRIARGCPMIPVGVIAIAVGAVNRNRWIAWRPAVILPTAVPITIMTIRRSIVRSIVPVP